MLRKRASTLLVQGLLSTVPEDTGPPIILATSVKTYVTGEDIVNHPLQAFARLSSASVTDNGTHFRFINPGGGTPIAGIPSKNDLVGDFSGGSALSFEGRIVSAGSAISILSFHAGSGAEPVAASSSAFARIFASISGDPRLEFFYRDLGGTTQSILVSSTYPIAETALIKIERTGGFFVLTGSTPTLGTVCASIAVGSVINGSSPMFANVRRESAVSEADEYEVNRITGYLDS